MKIVKYILIIIIKRKWWLIFLPLIATLLAIFFTRNQNLNFRASTTIFTGFASGYSIESGEKSNLDMNYVNNSMDNLINIIKSKTTLERVSLRLYSEHMIYGDKDRDNNTITKQNFLEIYNRTPNAVKKLIDKKSEATTLQRLDDYKKASPKNFVYGLFNWNHHHYCYDALNNIQVKKLENSDMMEISYESDDPGIAYNTIRILNEEFIKEYQSLRFGETDSVINYFQSELLRIGTLLRYNEDSLTNFNIKNRVINYAEQTSQIAYQSREYNLKYVELKMAYNSSKALLEEIENRMDANLKLIKDNKKFIQHLDNISKLSYDVAFLESTKTNTEIQSEEKIDNYKNELNKEEKKINSLVSNYSSQKYTKEGIAVNDIVNEWFSELIKNIKAEAELKVLEQRKLEIDDEYLFYSPIGSILKRKDREISFLENSYLNLLQNLNSALLRKKNLQMSSSTLRVINPPTFPLISLPSKRRMVIYSILLGSFLFLLSYFLLIELIDRTLKNKLKAELLIGKTILGIFPDSPKGKFRRYQNEIIGIAKHYLFNALINNLDHTKKQNIINIISNEKGEGKSFIAENLLSLFKEKDIDTQYISYHSDFNAGSSKYILANSINDICSLENKQIIIIEHPCLKDTNIPNNIIRSSSINLFIADSNRAWKDTDQLLFERLSKQCDEDKLFIFLNKASIEATEIFTGLLPPYSILRKLTYKFIQMEFRTK